MDKAAVIEIFRQLVEGVRYIHSQELLHRDLKVKISLDRSSMACVISSILQQFCF